MKCTSSTLPIVDVNQKLQNCRFELVKFNQDVKSKIVAIENCLGPRTVLNQLCHNVREKLNDCTEKIAEIEELQRIIKISADKDELSALIKRYKLETAQNLHNIRRATLVALKNIEASEQLQLMAKNKEIGNGDGKARATSNMAQDSASFSDNLMNLLRTMDGQVRQSEETLNALVGLSHVLGETEGEFRSMGSHISSSGKLLSKYSRREFTDRILFILALLFFFGTIFYIVKKRIF